MADIKFGRFLDALPSALACAAGIALAACSGSSGGSSTSPVQPGTHADLVRIEYGRLVDVYGLKSTAAGLVQERFARDVLVGPNIQDERQPGDNKRDEEVLYDFIASDPDTLQPRLFIPREITSQEFLDAVDALDARVSEVTPMAFGQASPTLPFTVMPRNAAIRLVFSSALAIDDSFFVTRGPSGSVNGLRNTEAVQLLQIVGDPNGANASRAFMALPARLIPNGRYLTIDPVLLGTEGIQYQARNNAAGLPESPDQIGANIRIALELTGAMAIPGLRDSTNGALLGPNNAGKQSIIRDFRSGNSGDSSAELARGFLRDPIPPRIVGNILTYLEQIEDVAGDPLAKIFTIYKNGVIHEIDQGDVFRLVVGNSGEVAASAEVAVDPGDDRGQPAVQHVRVRVRLEPDGQGHAPDLTDLQTLLGSAPTATSEREAWLVRNAPKSILVAEFTAGGNIVNGNVVGDDPRYFVTFSPAPLPYADGTPSQPDRNVSPFAGAVIRFTKPVDMSTVKPADTFFFATRNVLDQAAIDEFISTRPNGLAAPGMDPAAFNLTKFKTPHLVASRVFDEDGSQTSLRLQPPMGFFLNDAMRPRVNEGQNDPAAVDIRYFLHLVTGANGVRDLSGNPVDLQAQVVSRSSQLVIPFALDTRKSGGQPLFANNLSVSIVRTMDGTDNDENPSYYMPDEVQPIGTTDRYQAYALPDVFGASTYVNGVLLARPASRSTKIADNLNQAPVALQTSNLRWCPEPVSGEPQIASNTATAAFTGGGIQNPMNPYGARLQTVWREIDLSLSRVDPFDFNLDVEQMYWAPFTGSAIGYDEFDRVSLFLGHSEFRPEPCVGNFSALPTFVDSGLKQNFERNYVQNMRANVSNTVDSQPLPHGAYIDTPMTIDPAQSIYEPNQVNRYLPLPTFREPYFVYRDETVVEQGGVITGGSDLYPNGLSFQPFIISPFNNGNGRRVVYDSGAMTFLDAFWNSETNYLINNNHSADNFTQGLVGSIGLPLLADFWTYCDSPDLPAGNGYVALGTNGWQIAITVQSDPNPQFRAYSSGRAPVGSQPAQCRGPGDSAWNTASGGFLPNSTTPTRWGDNSFYWVMIDFLKRSTVVTNGFIDLLNPHRIDTTAPTPDPRLGPYYTAGATDLLPTDVVPTFSYDIDPVASMLPGGTQIVTQFRGAGIVDPSPWYWNNWGSLYPATLHTILQPTFQNFPLDPYKAGDAHIRKFDDRPLNGPTRNWWTYFYNRTVTSYVQDPNTLMDLNFLSGFAGPNDGFTPRDVRYLNWRFLMTSNPNATPPVSPSIDTFTLTYRFERAR